mgnify:CR=1 FL=1
MVVIGDPIFVAALRLAGAEGIEVKDDKSFIEALNDVFRRKDVGLVVLPSSMASKHRKAIAEMRRKTSLPIIYELPPVVGKHEPVDYKTLLRDLLGV